MRVCNVCKIEKDLEEYHNCKSLPLGKVYTCKPCAKQKTKAWNKANPEKKKRNAKVHYENNKESYKKRAKELDWRANNLEKSRANQRKWYRRSDGCFKMSFKRYKKVKATPRWLNEAQRREISNFYWLARDLKVITGEVYHVDHIIPINGKGVCGLHVPWNLQILPAKENISKSNRY